jgi:hypothetical protein
LNPSTLELIEKQVEAVLASGFGKVVIEIAHGKVTLIRKEELTRVEDEPVRH